MSSKSYKPFNPQSIGNTVSCYTLARMLDEVGSATMNRKVAAHISRYFAQVKEVAAAVECPKVREYIGEMMLREIKFFNVDILCPPNIINVIKNVKYCYVKDLLINEVPLNYIRDSSYECKPFYLQEDESVEAAFISGEEFRFNE